MAQAILCPVCKGKGKLNKTVGASDTITNEVVDCHGCGGKGWVEVGDSPSYPWPIWPPNPIPFYPYPPNTWTYTY